jgi:hypothetical protein
MTTPASTGTRRNEFSSIEYLMAGGGATAALRGSLGSGQGTKISHETTDWRKTNEPMQRTICFPQVSVMRLI